MAHIFKTAIGIVAFGALAGCTETTGGQSASQLPLAPDGPPFITTMSPDVSQASIDSCRSRLASQTSGAVTVVGGETSQAATAIYMRVGANGAPWRCLVNADGTNPRTMFMGSEGAA